MHLSIFILVINLLDAQSFLFYNKFISCLYMFQAPCAHHQGVKIVLYSLWYHRIETSEWSKITKIQFSKYEHCYPISPTLFQHLHEWNNSKIETDL